MEASEIRWEDRLEQIYVVSQTGQGILGAATTEAGTTSIVARQGSLTKPFHTERITLHRPSLAPIYGGPTLIEALWAEMDSIMERLMTGQDAEDGGDRFRAQELAWVIAITTNPYESSMDRVRAEAMERWNSRCNCVGIDHRNDCPEWEMPV